VQLLTQGCDLLKLGLELASYNTNIARPHAAQHKTVVAAGNTLHLLVFVWEKAHREKAHSGVLLHNQTTHCCAMEATA
jgi:hypothetical protein